MPKGALIYLPSDDGVTHINVYSKGQTNVGRWMSNFAFAPFFHSKHGGFNSIEGLWYWLSCKNDKLRLAHGYAAKKLGRELRAPDWVHTPAFREDIVAGIKAKLAAHQHEAQLVRATRLPLAHYYVFGTDQVHDMTAECKWMLDVFDQWRRT